MPTNSAVLALRRMLWRVRTHGLHRGVQLATIRLWRRLFNNRDELYVIDCADVQRPAIGTPSLRIRHFVQVDEIPAPLMQEFASRKGGRALATDALRRFFARGAVLWTAEIGGRLAAYHWTARRGLDGYFFHGLSDTDEVICAAEVFPEFRGRGAFPQLIRHSVSVLAERGSRRVFASCKVWNVSSRHALEKAGLVRIGRARMLRFPGRRVVVWTEP